MIYQHNKKPLTKKCGQLITCLIVGFIFALTPSTGGAAEKIQLGVLLETHQNGTNQFIDLLKQEIDVLVGSKYDVSIPEKMIRATSGTRQSILKEYQRLAANKNLRAIIVIGAINADQVAKFSQFSKPTIVLGIVDHELQNISITETGASGVHNLTYVLPVLDLVTEIQTFREIYSFDRLTIIVNKQLTALIPEISRKLKQRVGAQGITIQGLTYNGDIDQLVAKFPVDTEAVLYSGLLRMPIAEKQKLINHVNQLALPSYSFRGIPDVKIGVLAGSAAETNSLRIARRIALNIESTLMGKNPSSLPTPINIEKRLTINMETARSIGFSPSWSTLARADLINKDNFTNGRVLDLSSVITEALANNIQLGIEARNVRVAEEEVNKAKSDLFPSLALSTSATKIDENHASAFNPEETTSASLSLNQVIYSESSSTNLAVQKHKLASVQSAEQEIALNTTLQAGIAYLDILRAKTTEHIQKNHLELIRRNHEVAEFRRRVGYSGAADVYRWESEQATATSNLVAAQTNVQVVKMQLNEFLSRPLDEVFIVNDIGINDQVLERHGGDEILASVDRPQSFQRFMHFVTDEAHSNLPELEKLQESIAAQQRIVSASKRKRYVPTVGIQSSATQFFSTSGVGSGTAATDDPSWSIGLSASWPLYQGGRINAETRQAFSEQTKLQDQLRDMMRKVELNVRSRVFDLRVKTANLRLTKKAAVAAKSNYQLVRDAYSQGTTSIVSMLDAQNASLNAEQSEANSVYEYYISLLNVERAMGSFAITSSPDEQAAFLQRFHQYMDSAAGRRSNK